MFWDNIYIEILIATVAVAVTLFDLWLIRRVRKEMVIVAEAGQISDMSPMYQPYVYMNPIRKIGNAMPLEYRRVIVHGHCMEPRGIMDCSQLWVKSINQDKEFSLQVKHDDILLIYLADKDIYKLRVFDKYLDDNRLLTYRFNPKTCERVDSSVPHSRDSVIGVVKYAV